MSPLTFNQRWLWGRDAYRLPDEPIRTAEYDVAELVDDGPAKLMKRLGDTLPILWKPVQESGRQFIGSGVDPHDHRISDSADRREQSVHEMHESLLPLGLD